MIPCALEVGEERYGPHIMQLVLSWWSLADVVRICRLNRCTYLTCGVTRYLAALHVISSGLQGADPSHVAIYCADAAQFDLALAKEKAFREQRRDDIELHFVSPAGACKMFDWPPALSATW